MNKKEKNKGLGRGLDALFGAPLSEDWMSDEKDGLAVEELRLSEVAPGRMQPRSRMEPEALEALAASIREEGILSPLIVRKTDAGYEIVAGERRYQAAKMIGLETVPAIVRELDDRHALAVGLIENIQRENLNPIEEALGVRRLQEEFGLTHEECAKAIAARDRPPRTFCGSWDSTKKCRRCSPAANSRWGTPVRSWLLRGRCRWSPPSASRSRRFRCGRPRTSSRK